MVSWGVDGYFLWQERLYRALCDRVRPLPEAEIAFSMDVRPVRDNVTGWSVAVFSPTLLALHGVLIVAIIINMVIVLRNA